MCTHSDSCGSRPAAPRPPEPPGTPQQQCPNLHTGRTVCRPFPSRAGFFSNCRLFFFSISDFQLRIFRKDTEQCGLEQSQHRDNEHLPWATRAFSRRRFSVPREDALSRAVRDGPAFGARVATPSPWSTAPGVGGSWPLTFRGIGKSPGEQRPLLLSVAPSALGRCRLCGRRGRGGRNMLAPPGRDAA